MQGRVPGDRREDESQGVDVAEVRAMLSDEEEAPPSLGENLASAAEAAWGQIQ